MNQAEIFYQTMLGLSEPYLTRDNLVLDLGCALGRLSAEYSKRVKHVIGLDYSDVMVRTAKKIVTSEKTERIRIPIRITGNDYANAYIEGLDIPNCDFIVADAESLPFSDRLFDFIAGVNLLDRTRSPKKAISEMARVLKPRGRLLITCPYDWRREFTPDENEWTRNMKTLFDDQGWKVLNDADGIPSYTKMHERAFSITITHALVLAKK
jgi:ubiquinone/menaquinone biosynthesis C-methylase UbiE